MNQGTILGSQIGRWIILAALVALLGALLLTIRPVAAQNVVTQAAEVRENSTDTVRLRGTELDRRQVTDRWELVADANDPAADLTNFPDYRLFEIDRLSGVLSFKSPPDYENPRSMSTGTLAERNVYKVKAKFGDGERYLAVELTVRVTGVEEAETLTLSARLPEVGNGITASLSGGDIRGLRTPDWQWQVEDGSGGWTDIEDAVNSEYEPRADDVGKKLRAYVSYQDSHDDDLTETGSQFIIGTGVTEFPVRAKPTSKIDPVFRDNDETAGTNVGEAGIQTGRRIEENSAPGTYIGPPVFATDNDVWRLDASLSAQVDPPVEPGGPRDVLTYSLQDVTTAEDTNAETNFSGNAALFSIDQATGQIMTKAPLDYEGADIVDRTAEADDHAYRFLAIATDPSGVTGQATVTIHVLDVDEGPQVTGPTALSYFENTFVDPAATPRVHELRLDRNPLDALAADDTELAVYTATDNDLDDDEISATTDSPLIQWQLTGDDASKLQFVGSTDIYTNSATVTAATTTVGVTAVSPALQFKSAPDSEAAGDKDKNNVYEITVKAWDGDWLIGSRDVTIRVANADDEGMVTLSHIQPEVGTSITATLTDPDGIGQTVTWTWESPADTAATGTVVDTRINATTVTSTYTPVAADTGALFVRAEYTDSDGTRYIDSDDPARVVDDKDPPSATSGDTRPAPVGSNQDPKFYKNGVDQDPPETADGDDTNERLPKNEAKTYTRYVLENTTRNVALSEVDARVYDTNTAPDVVDVPVNGVVNAYDTWTNDAAEDADPTADGTDGNAFLHYSLSGADAKYFEIPNATVVNADNALLTKTRGVIRTKGSLDFEPKRSYTVTVTATDPGGETDTVTVTINVVDVPEIEQVESRQWVPENTKEIVDLATSLRGDVSKGGWKWSLLTGPDTGSASPVVDPVTEPVHNRTSAESIDCVYDATNDGLCDNFRFSNFNGASTELLFAIGTGADHNAPDFEKPSDRGTTTNADDADAKDNVYKIVVRVAFANLRSQEPAAGTTDVPVNHPNPQSDERQDFPVWIRVVDVDEDPSFADASSTRLITENSDDNLPAIGINRSVPATVAATDPEYGYESGPQFGKKLVYSLDAGDYSNLFQIVPSSGEILTRSRLKLRGPD